MENLRYTSFPLAFVDSRQLSIVRRNCLNSATDFAASTSPANAAAMACRSCCQLNHEPTSQPILSALRRPAVSFGPRAKARSSRFCRPTPFSPSSRRSLSGVGVLVRTKSADLPGISSVVNSVTAEYNQFSQKLSPRKRILKPLARIELSNL